MSSLESALAAVVGTEHVLVDPALTASYETDWTRRFSAPARCVVRPATSEQVAEVVRACADARVSLTVQGGNTGLVGGSVPAEGDVLLSLTRLDHCEPVDVTAGQVTVGAGVSLAALQRHVRAHGLDFGVDFAARDSATMGGLAATNAGGERVLRYGTTRQHVLGVEAVLADGSIVSRLGGLPKDNTGYDLTALLCGSEGTLGIITRLRLRLVPLLPHRAVALIAVAHTADAVMVGRHLQDRLTSLEAAELIFADGMDLVRNHTGLPAPFPEPYDAYVLAECADRTDPTEALVEALADSPGVRDATIASDARGRQSLWAYRESHTEAINAAGVPLKLDVAVPLRLLADAAAELPGTIRAVAPDSRLIPFGHLLEGNLHVNVLGVGERAEEVTAAVLTLVASYSGSISAEHGIGRAKARWLHLSRSAAEIAAMRAVKHALDPHRLLNPGVLLP